MASSPPRMPHNLKGLHHPDLPRHLTKQSPSASHSSPHKHSSGPTKSSDSHSHSHSGSTHDDSHHHHHQQHPPPPLTPPANYHLLSTHTVHLPIPTITSDTNTHTHTYSPSRKHAHSPSTTSTASSHSHSTTTSTRTLKRLLAENSVLAQTAYEKACTLFLSSGHLQTITSLSALCRDFQVLGTTYPTTHPNTGLPPTPPPPPQQLAATATASPSSSSSSATSSTSPSSSGGKHTTDQTQTQSPPPSSTTHFTFAEHIPLPLGLTSILKLKPTVVAIQGVYYTYPSPTPPPPSGPATSSSLPSSPPQIQTSYALYTTTATASLSPKIHIWKTRQVTLTPPPPPPPPARASAPNSSTPPELHPHHVLTVTEHLYAGMETASQGFRWYVGKEARKAHVLHMESYSAFFGEWVGGWEGEDG